jgi:hypothetical protein
MTVHIFNDESLGYTLNIKDLINLDMTNRFRYDTVGQHDDGGLKLYDQQQHPWAASAGTMKEVCNVLL